MVCSFHTVLYNLNSFIKGYDVYQDIGTPELFEELVAVRETQNTMDKYAVSVTKAGKVVGHLKKGKTGRFAKIIFYFLRADKQNSCTAVVTGKAVNRGDGEGMSVPCTLKFEGQKKHISILMSWARTTSNENEQTLPDVTVKTVQTSV